MYVAGRNAGEAAKPSLRRPTLTSAALPVAYRPGGVEVRRRPVNLAVGTAAPEAPPAPFRQRGTVP